MTEYVINSLEELTKTAKEILRDFDKNKMFAFYGKMGSGKTTIIKALCEELGSNDNITSPTFAIVNQYNTFEKGLIYHFDFYRIKSQEEVFDIGYEDYFYNNNYCFIEWPELIENLLPDNCIKVKIDELNKGVRKILIEGTPENSEFKAF